MAGGRITRQTPEPRLRKPLLSADHGDRDGGYPVTSPVRGRQFMQSP